MEIINSIFLVTWVCILIAVCISNNKTFLKWEAIIGAFMGIMFYLEKLFS
jgi:hypothetical protein